MPPNNTIVARLTADPRDMQRGFSVAAQASDQLNKKLEDLNRTANRGFASPRGTPGGGGRFGGGLASGALELSRGLEDASIGFQLNGIQGAVRGAANNLSQFAFIMGGPVAGAIAGLTAAALPTLINKVFGVGESAAESKKKLDQLRDSLERVAEQARVRVQFEGVLNDLPDAKAADSQLKNLQQRLREVNAEFSDLERERRDPGGPGQAPGWEFAWQQQARMAREFDSVLARDREVGEKQNKLLEDRARLETQINQILNRRTELQEQDEFGQRLDEAAKKADERVRDMARIQDILTGKLRGLGGEVDPLEGLNIPRGLGGDLRDLFKELDAMGQGRSAQFANVATRDSQALLRTQAQAKEAAEAKKQREKLIQKIEKLIDEVKRQRNPDADLDDVNIL